MRVSTTFSRSARSDSFSITAASALTISSALRVSVIVGGCGERNQHCRLSGGGKFGHRRRSTARHNQIGLGEPGGHVIEKSADLPLRGIGAAGLVGGLGSFYVTHSGLVKNGEARDGREQVRRDSGQGDVKQTRALRSPEDKQMRSLSGFRRKLKKSGRTGIRSLRR